MTHGRIRRSWTDAPRSSTSGECLYKAKAGRRDPSMLKCMFSVVAVLSSIAVTNQNAAATTWTKLDSATIVGRRSDVPIGFAPGLDRFIILGGRSNYADYRK